MSTIGTFTKQDNAFSGTLRTLTLNVKCKIIPIDRPSTKGPDFRVMAGPLEIGAAWKRQSKAHREYLSVRIDDPSLATPINCRLIGADDLKLTLYWTRRTTD